MRETGGKRTQGHQRRHHHRLNEHARMWRISTGNSTSSTNFRYFHPLKWHALPWSKSCLITIIAMHVGNTHRRGGAGQWPLMFVHSHRTSNICLPIPKHWWKVKHTGATDRKQGEKLTNKKIQLLSVLLLLLWIDLGCQESLLIVHGISSGMIQFDLFSAMLVSVMEFFPGFECENSSMARW